jgi:hypothetical protein
VSVDTSDEATLVRPSEEAGSKTAWWDTTNDQSVPPYQPPSYVPPGTPSPQRGRKAWPWVVGLVALLLLGGLGIAGAILIPRMMRASSNQNSSNTNRGVSNSNRNDSKSNADDNTNQNDDSDGENAGPPTDEDKVLADLTDLEHEWTVANINADKKKLDKILADDYVGTSADGNMQGKAEYLRTIERDNTIQNWQFEDMKVKLNGDRASLTGIIRLQIQNQPVAYRFTDKFVWRDGRWQATASEVTPVK